MNTVKTVIGKSLRMIAMTSALLVAIEASAAPGAEVSADAPSNRVKNKLGAGLSIGEPFPTILGFNAGYNVTDYLRAQLGYGSVEVTTGISANSEGVQTSSTKATTVGAGLKGFMPGWNLSPTAGLHYSHTSFSGDGELEINGVKSGGSLIYSSLGVDWQAGNGFNLAAGYNLPLSGGSGGSFFASAGWFFDVIN